MMLSAFGKRCVLASALEGGRLGPMSTLLEVQNAALHLTEKDRWQLAESLLGSLAPTSADDADDLLAEVEARDQEIESGRVTALDETAFWAGVRRKV